MMPLTLTLLTAAVPAAKRGMALRHLGRGQRPRGRQRPADRRQPHRAHLLAVDLLAERPARPGPAAARPPAPRRVLRPRARALDVPGTAAGQRRPLRHRLRAWSAAPSDGWTSPLVLTGLIAGAAAPGRFVRHGIRAKNPMLPMRLFRNRAFSGINAASLLMFLGHVRLDLPAQPVPQGVLGYSPTEAGLRMLPWTGMPMLVAPVAGILSDRIGGRPVVATGLFLQAVGPRPTSPPSVVTATSPTPPSCPA